MDEPLGAAIGNSLEVIESVEVLRGGGPADIRDALAMLDDGRVRAQGIVTHHVPFDQVDEGFRLARTGEALKVVIDF